MLAGWINPEELLYIKYYWVLPIYNYLLLSYQEVDIKRSKLYHQTLSDFTKLTGGMRDVIYKFRVTVYW